MSSSNDIRDAFHVVVPEVYIPIGIDADSASTVVSALTSSVNIASNNSVDYESDFSTLDPQNAAQFVNCVEIMSSANSRGLHVYLAHSDVYHLNFILAFNEGPIAQDMKFQAEGKINTVSIDGRHKTTTITSEHPDIDKQIMASWTGSINQSFNYYYGVPVKVNHSDQPGVARDVNLSIVVYKFAPGPRVKVENVNLTIPPPYLIYPVVTPMIVGSVPQGETRCDFGRNTAPSFHVATAMPGHYFTYVDAVDHPTGAAQKISPTITGDRGDTILKSIDVTLFCNNPDANRQAATSATVTWSDVSFAVRYAGEPPTN